MGSKKTGFEENVEPNGGSVGALAKGTDAGKRDRSLYLLLSQCLQLDFHANAQVHVHLDDRIVAFLSSSLKHKHKQLRENVVQELRGVPFVASNRCCSVRQTQAKDAHCPLPHPTIQFRSPITMSPQPPNAFLQLAFP